MNTDDPIKGYHIKRLSVNNLHDLEKLHTVVYGAIPPANFYFMKYNTAYTGVEYIGFIAYNNEDLPIGYYGVIPCFIKFDDRIVLAAQSADTMTHPQFRFKGLFVELSNITFQLCRDNDIQLLFGFPNQNSLPGAINKLGWHMTDRMDCFIIQTGAFSWYRLFNKLLLLKSLYADYQQRILKKHLKLQHGIANSAFNDGYAGVYRDQHYFNYKCYTHSQVIKIGNATLWVKIGREFLIGDILVNAHNFENVMNKLKKLARKLGISELHFHTSPGTTLHTLFSNRFTAIPSFHALFQDFEGGVPINKIKFTSADIDTF